jgi:N-acyl-D-amino-acid deacylase
MRRFTLLLAALLLPACAATTDAGPWDILIAGATIIDGTGAAGYTGHVAVRGDRIVAISRRPLAADRAARVIDGTGHVLAPGFIDLHSHLDPLLDLPDSESLLRQGVTLGLGNPDGGGPVPLAPYFDSITAVRTGMNVAFLVGHNTIRRQVMGSGARAPTDDELDRMRALVQQAMDDGAFGISTGLRYTPGVFSEIDEVVALSEVAARNGGIYTSHLRDEGMDLIAGVAEAIEIGRRASIPIVLTHHKVVGAPMFGASVRTLAMIDSARAAGIDVMADQYPYAASYTGISILLPPWALDGGNAAFLRRLDDATLRDSILAGTEWNIINDRGGNDLRRVQFARVSWDRSLEGRTLYDWAVRQGLDTTPAIGAQLVVEAMRRGGASTIFHAMHEDDVERIMRHPWTAIASDGRLVRPGDGHPHPRWYGTFPRVLGHYVRERGVLSLEDAIRKMTSLPAWRLGLDDRGVIREGAAADLVLFDPATVIDRATFEEPHQYPTGIPYVIVNGVVTVDDNIFMDARAGLLLRRPGS